MYNSTEVMEYFQSESESTIFVSFKHQILTQPYVMFGVEYWKSLESVCAEKSSAEVMSPRKGHWMQTEVCIPHVWSKNRNDLVILKAFCSINQTAENLLHQFC